MDFMLPVRISMYTYKLGWSSDWTQTDTDTQTAFLEK